MTGCIIRVKLNSRRLQLQFSSIFRKSYIIKKFFRNQQSNYQEKYGSKKWLELNLYI